MTVFLCHGNRCESYNTRELLTRTGAGTLNEVCLINQSSYSWWMDSRYSFIYTTETKAVRATTSVHVLWPQHLQINESTSVKLNSQPRSSKSLGREEKERRERQSHHWNDLLLFSAPLPESLVARLWFGLQVHCSRTGTVNNYKINSLQFPCLWGLSTDMKYDCECHSLFGKTAPKCVSFPVNH